MNIKNINIIFMLIAGIIVSFISFIQNYSLIKFTITIIIVLLLFFVIGTIIRAIINAVINSTKKEEELLMRKLAEEEYEKSQTIDSITKDEVDNGLQKVDS